MEKTNRIIYWIATLWLSLGMISTGVVQLLDIKAEQDYITHLGFPAYFLKILGFWKILGVIALLVPKFLLLKEWAYAGFFFVTTGAVTSHIIAGDPITGILPSLLLLSLTIISWCFRPVNRKAVLAN